MKRLVILLSAATLAYPGADAAQRQIEVDPPNSKNPVMITKVTAQGYEIQCHLLNPPGLPQFQPIAPFEWGDDWLQNLDIEIFNRTNKAIAFGRITLSFPESKTMPNAPTAVIHLDFGIAPPNDFLANGQPFPHRSGEQPVSLAPGKSLVIHAADYADTIRRALDGVKPGWVPNRMAIGEGYFLFSDGMRWSFRRYSIPDPEHPGRWIYQEPSYFPGKSDDNWPAPGYRWGRWTPVPVK